MPIAQIMLLAAASIADENATSGQTCRVLEASYTAAIKSSVQAYPRNIVPSSRTVDLREFHADYRAGLPLKTAEFADLAGRQNLYAVQDYRPVCVPASVPAVRKDAEGHVQHTSFTSPIFSSDGHIAVTEVSFREAGGGFGYGMFCVARRSGMAWSATCVGSWVT
nr:hypothetical protein [uncultured Sphingomonas sp.]